MMSIEDGADIAGMGGLMGTAMVARGFAGAVIDGSVRDSAYLLKIGFPVYATGVAPSTSVGHYRFAGAQIPVVCDGIAIRAGDIVTADNDGVVVIPREKAVEVLKLAQEMDFKEHSMYAWIEKLKSIQEAVKQFGRALSGYHRPTHPREGRQHIRFSPLSKLRLHTHPCGRCR